MVVLESEKGELKKKVSKFMMVSVAYFSSMMSAWYRSKVLLQTWKIPEQDMFPKRLTNSSKRIVLNLLTWLPQLGVSEIPWFLLTNVYFPDQLN